jgi:endonuclease YncB( thermonuclease family)
MNLAASAGAPSHRSSSARNCRYKGLMGFKGRKTTRRCHLTIAIVFALTFTSVLAVATNGNEASALTWKATVVNILDGDTFEARLDGESSLTIIRIAGLQTNETHGGANGGAECQAGIQTDRLTELLTGKRVVLTARQATSMSLGRPIRHTFVGGVNIAETMLAEGHGVPLSFENEPDYAIAYTTAALSAAAKRLGVWDDDACGIGPAPNARLEMVTNFDAASDDEYNVNGEYVQLRNRGSETLNFDGWQLSDSSLRRFAFPTGTRLEPDGRIRVYMGHGTDTTTSIYLGEDAPVLGNESDAMFLYDPDFDIRAWDMWPCTEDCVPPAPFGIAHVQADAPGDDRVNPNGEYVVIRNIGSRTENFQDWMLQIDPYQITSIASRPIPPGGSITIFVGPGSNTSNRLYFNRPSGIISNTSHLVTLNSPDRVVASCSSSGSRSCPIQPDRPVPPIDAPARALQQAQRLN